MHTIIDFYEKIPTDQKGCYKRGCFYWTCFPYAFESPRVTRFWNNRPTETLDITTFDPSNNNFDPNSGLGDDEFQAVTIYKRRPVILLSSKCEEYDPKGLHGGEYYVVAPLRSTRIIETNEYKFPPGFVWNTILYKYNSIFFLPCAEDQKLRESIILFERMTTLHHTWLTTMNDIQLTHDAQTCVDMWLRNFLFDNIPTSFNQNLESYRELMGDDPKIKNQIIGTAKYL